MDERAAVGAAAVETDVLDNVQGAEDSRPYGSGGEFTEMSDTVSQGAYRK